MKKAVHEVEIRSADNSSQRSGNLLQSVLTSRWLHYSLLALYVAVIAVQAVLFDLHLRHHGGLVLTDFNAYYITGRMVLAGHGDMAYNWSALHAEQLRQTGTWAFMPWAYPPQFTLLTGLLALLPIGLAYLLFVGGSFAIFYTALRRLSGRYSAGALAFALPAILINARCGQNGFLTAGLIGWFLIALRNRSAEAGWPLGAMVVKPHLAIAVSLLALIERRWSVLLRAAALVIGTAMVGTFAFGWRVWPTFLAATSATSHYLWIGRFPLERMTSVFAALDRFGMSPSAAMAVHVVIALSALAILMLAWKRGLAERRLLALVTVVSLLISPYTYDYDMVTIALTAGLLLPDILAKAKPWEIIVLFMLSWISTSNYLWIGLRQLWYGVKSIDWTMGLWTISPITIGLMIFLAFRVLRVRPY